MSPAFDEGFNDFFKGRPRDWACYEEGGKEHTDWLAGWDCAAEGQDSPA